jgi:hypothetical protein
MIETVRDIGLPLGGIDRRMARDVHDDVRPDGRDHALHRGRIAEVEGLATTQNNCPTDRPQRAGERRREATAPAQDQDTPQPWRSGPETGIGRGRTDLAPSDAMSVHVFVSAHDDVIVPSW